MNHPDSSQRARFAGRRSEKSAGSVKLRRVIRWRRYCRRPADLLAGGVTAPHVRPHPPGRLWAVRRQVQRVNVGRHLQGRRATCHPDYSTTGTARLSAPVHAAEAPEGRVHPRGTLLGRDSTRRPTGRASAWRRSVPGTIARPARCSQAAGPCWGWSVHGKTAPDRDAAFEPSAPAADATVPQPRRRAAAAGSTTVVGMIRRRQ